MARIINYFKGLFISETSHEDAQIIKRAEEMEFSEMPNFFR